MAKTKTSATAEAPAMSKVDAVRAAIRDGVVMPKEGAEHIKARYGLDVAPNLLSAHKTRVMEGPGGGLPEKSAAGPEPAKQPEAVRHDAPTPKAPKPEEKASPEPETVPEASPEPAQAGSPADLARQVKQLVEWYGAGAVREMTGVFEG